MNNLKVLATLEVCSFLLWILLLGVTIVFGLDYEVTNALITYFISDIIFFLAIEVSDKRQALEKIQQTL